MRPELLSPAGDWDGLRAAVANGADAVYIGTTEFNARSRARNFPLDGLDAVVAFCHDRGVRVYLTLNTLVKNQEIDRFSITLSRAYRSGINGVIIQHFSLLAPIKEQLPGLAVFLSTQAAIGNPAAASLFGDADRIILPREMHLTEVRKVVEAGARVEVFVHGALCFGYSGQCLFSSFVGNRSGNRGCCAQLCRQQYNGCYRLSTKELCLVRKVPELIEAGINGFKIEGRMRSPLYVAVATRLYRKAIDSCLEGRFVVPQKELGEIEVVFNREFTEGFMFGESDLVSTEKPMNRGAFLGQIDNGETVLQRRLAVGDGVGVWAGKTVEGTRVREIRIAGKPVTTADAGTKAALGLGAQDGSKVYLTSSALISEAPDSPVKRPPIHNAERRAIKLSLKYTVGQTSKDVKLLARVYSTREASEAAQSGADMVFYDVFATDFPEQGSWPHHTLLGAYLPRILTADELSLAFRLLSELKPSVILAGNLGFLARRAEFKVPVYVDYAMNAFNDVDVAFFHRHQAIPVLSPELSLKELTEFRNRNAAILCHGDIVLVNTRIELKDDGLTNDKGVVFPVRREDSYWQILNSRPFGMFNDILQLQAAGFSQFFIDRQGHAGRLVDLYRKILRGEPVNRRLRKGHTAGHLYRPVE